MLGAERDNEEESKGRGPAFGERKKALRNVLSLKRNNKPKLMSIQFKKNPGSKHHAKQAAELGYFGHVVLELES